MANRATLCQHFVSAALQGIRQQYPACYIIHYMDGIRLVLADRSY